MKLLLLRRADGAGLAINVKGLTRTIQIPLAEGVSLEIEKMLEQEQIRPEGLLLPPGHRPA